MAESQPLAWDGGRLPLGRARRRDRTPGYRRRRAVGADRRRRPGRAALGLGLRRDHRPRSGRLCGHYSDRHLELVNAWLAERRAAGSTMAERRTPAPARRRRAWSRASASARSSTPWPAGSAWPARSPTTAPGWSSRSRVRTPQCCGVSRLGCGRGAASGPDRPRSAPSGIRLRGGTRVRDRGLGGRCRTDADLPRHRHLRRLPGRAGRSGRPPLPAPVHQLHQLRTALHDHHRPAVRPAGDDHGRLPAVPGLRGGVRRSRRSPVPRPDGRLPRLRADAHAAPAGRRPTLTGDDAMRRGPRAAERRARSWPSRDSAATTWPATPSDATAVSTLRKRKDRGDKPFAIMVADPARRPRSLAI